MGNSRDLERAHAHRMLFEKMMAKVDHSKDHDEREEEAKFLMALKLGPKWEEEAEVEGVGFIDKCQADDYYAKMDKVMDEEGMAEAPEAPEHGDLITRLKKLLEEYER